MSARDEIPHWVRKYCQIWGAQKRRAWLGEEYYLGRDGKWVKHVDGYANSIFGKLRDERTSAGTPGGVRGQLWPEVFMREGLDVQRAIRGLPIDAYDVLHLQYVFDPRWEIPIKKRARLLGLRRVQYYNFLGIAEMWVFSRLDESYETVGTDNSLTGFNLDLTRR